MNPWVKLLLFFMLIATVMVVVGTLAIYGVVCLIYRKVNKKAPSDLKSDGTKRKEIQ